MRALQLFGGNSESDPEGGHAIEQQLEQRYAQYAAKLIQSSPGNKQTGKGVALVRLGA